MIKGFVEKCKLRPPEPRHVETYCGYDIVYEKGKYVIFQNSLALEWSYSRGNAKDWINIQLRKKRNTQTNNQVNNQVKERDWIKV